MYTPAKKPVHLVKNFHEVPASKRDTVLLGSEKVDGVYCFLRKGICYSRTGKEYISGGYIAHHASVIMPDDVVIGEFMLFDADGNTLPVNEISGAFRRNEVRTDAVLVVHDIIPDIDFDAGYCGIEFEVRIDQAHQLYCQHPCFIENKQTLLYGQHHQEQYASGIIDNGGEGAVFKQAWGTWTAGKKNEVQMKIKGELSYDLEVVGVEIGKGKYSGTLGKLVCRWTDGRVVRVSGMTDQQRHDWWHFPNCIIGYVVKVDCMCLTPDGMLREPRFKEVRVDKTKGDV